MRLRRLLITLALACAVLAPSAMGGKMKFTGSASIASDGQLIVSFTEASAGKADVSYRLQAIARARFACDGIWLGDSGSWGGPSWNDPSQNLTVTPIKGRASGTLSHPMMSTDIFSPCPNNGVRTLFSITWSDITVTSTTGRVLALDSVSTPS